MSCSDVQEVAYTIYGPCNRNSGPEAHANDDKRRGSAIVLTHLWVRHTWLILCRFPWLSKVQISRENHKRDSGRQQALAAIREASNLQVHSRLITFDQEELA